MSGRARRPASGSAEVVSIGTRRADYSRLASGHVIAARQKLGISQDDFARLMEDMLGWDILPETIAAWEDDVTPPGDVLLACAAAGQVSPADAPGLMVPLLAAVSPAFPVATLAGPWVTCYQFAHAGEPRYHADIAHVTVTPHDRIYAVNHPPEPRSEGRPRPFRNEIDAGLAGRHLIGEWRNVSDTRYYGSVQLAVLPGETVMEGWYSGVGSDIQVSTGFWKWVRLDPRSVPEEGMTGVSLREPAALHDVIMSHSQYGEPLTLADVREEP